MFKKKNNEKNTYGIVGLGRFGHALALELAAAGAELVVLDKEEEKVRELREYTENAYVVHALDKKTLSETDPLKSVKPQHQALPEDTSI